MFLLWEQGIRIGGGRLSSFLIMASKSGEQNGDGDTDLAPFVQKQGERIDPADAVKIFNATAVNLNLHSSVRDVLVGQGDFVNPRTFELACCQAFHLVDRRSLLGEMFSEDEVAVFETIDELREKIGYYLARPRERQQMA